MEAAIAEAGGMMFMEDGHRDGNYLRGWLAAEQRFSGRADGGGQAAAHRRIAVHDRFSKIAAQGRSMLPSARLIRARSFPFIWLRSAGSCWRRKMRFSALPRASASGSPSPNGLAPACLAGKDLFLERLQGDGLAFLHAGGTIYQRDLARRGNAASGHRMYRGVSAHRRLRHPVCWENKVALFGGEGLFFATLRGPGRVWLQSLPLSRLAGRIYAAAPQKGGRREEGSVLGGLGRLLDGDNSWSRAVPRCFRWNTAPTKAPSTKLHAPNFKLQTPAMSWSGRAAR